MVKFVRMDEEKIPLGQDVNLLVAAEGYAARSLFDRLRPLDITIKVPKGPLDIIMYEPEKLSDKDYVKRVGLIPNGPVEYVFNKHYKVKCDRRRVDISSWENITHRDKEEIEFVGWFSKDLFDGKFSDGRLLTYNVDSIQAVALV